MPNGSRGLALALRSAARRSPVAGCLQRSLSMVALACLVQWPPTPVRAQPAATPPTAAGQASLERLPAAVLEMRELILAAVRSGRLEDLREAVEWNELPPAAGQAPGGDAIAHWLTATGDPEGRALLTLLGHLLAGEPRHIEATTSADGPARNARRAKPGRGGAVAPGLYVWPAAAEVPPSRWTPTQVGDLAGWLAADAIAAMQSAGRYTSWRLGIGADGTWHSLEKVP